MAKDWLNHETVMYTMAESRRSGIIVRRTARPDELPQCLELYARVIQPYLQPDSGWQQERERATFLATVRPDNTGLHIRNDEVIGFDSFYERPSDIWLNGIYILADHDANPEMTVVGYIVQVSALARLTKKKMRLRILKVLPHVDVYRKWGFQILDEDDNHFWLEGTGTYGN